MYSYGNTGQLIGTSRSAIVDANLYFRVHPSRRVFPMDAIVKRENNRHIVRKLI